MTDDLMTRLRDADPVARVPEPPPLHTLRLDDHPPAPRRRSPRRRLVLVPALALAAVLAALVVVPSGSSPDVVAEARQALGPEGGVLHYVLRRTEARPDNARVEVWVTRSPFRERMQVGEDGLTFRSDYADGVHRQIMRGKELVTVNRATPENQAEYERDAPSPTGLGADPLEGIRTMLAEGRLREDGTTEIGGRAVRRLTGTQPAGPTPGGATRPAVTWEYYVDAETYAPVRLVDRWDQPNGTGTTDFEVYERLPSTPENLAQLRLPGIDGMETVEP